MQNVEVFSTLYAYRRLSRSVSGDCSGPARGGGLGRGVGVGWVRWFGGAGELGGRLRR